MTLDEAHTVYIREVDAPNGKDFAAMVGRFQEGFLADRVTRDIDEAFRRAVEASVKLIPAMNARAAARASLNAELTRCRAA